MAKTLYERLGGADGIARLVDDAVDAHLSNPEVKTRFENTKDIEHAKKMSREFFCAGAGGPETYTGRDMRTAHKGMNISEQEYVAVVDEAYHTYAVRSQFNADRYAAYPLPGRHGWVSVAYSFK